MHSFNTHSWSLYCVFQFQMPFFPHPSSSSLTSASCPAMHSSSDTPYPRVSTETRPPNPKIRVQPHKHSPISDTSCGWGRQVTAVLPGRLQYRGSQDRSPQAPCLQERLPELRKMLCLKQFTLKRCTAKGMGQCVRSVHALWGCTPFPAPL